MVARDFYPIARNHAFGHCGVMNTDEFVQKLRKHIEVTEGLTPAGLAKSAKIDTSTIRKLLSGENSSPKVATAEKICAAMGTSLHAFMGRGPNEDRQEILDLYNQLSDEERRLLIAAAKGLAAQDRGA